MTVDPVQWTAALLRNKNYLLQRLKTTEFREFRA